VTTPVVELTEYGTRELPLPQEVVGQLLATGSTAVAVAPTSISGHWRLTASSQVGTLAVPGLHVHIRPKVGIANVLGLLDGGLPSDAWRTPDVGLATSPELLPVFAEFFARSVLHATSRGLVRRYREHEDVLIAPRGRIDFTVQLRRSTSPSPLACRFDEFTTDVPENQLLLGTVERLLGLAEIPPRVRNLLRSLRSRFEEVAAARPLPTDFDRIHLTRLTEHYRGPLRLARLVAENLSLRDVHGATAVSSFLLDMPRVYEEFVSRRLARALRGRLEVRAQVSTWLSQEGQVPVRPDLVFFNGRTPVFVGEVKYKVAPLGLARSSDYYQLLAYCQTLGLTDGVLIYAQSDDEPPASTVTVKHSGIRLHTYRLDIGGDLKDLGAALRRLASWIRDHASGHAPS
jgi:5-methylcytosine-specific restriction enzyme subunit McrC